MAECPRCGEENAEQARFCSACGLALLPRGGLRRTGEELRVVTALFVDIADFTGRAETLEPEDVAGVLRPYYLRVRAELERFGGRVEKFIGDAVMALFGAPVAHEDDAERAVRAAFAVRDSIAELNAADPSLDLRVRVGVNTGQALVALGARSSEGEGLAAGDVLNTASRLQKSAPLDGILVGEATYRATAHVVDYGPARELGVRGKVNPVSVRQALAPKPRRAFDLARRGFAPLVGRRHELDALLQAVQGAHGSRSPRLIAVTGGPGLGKTRLLWELFHSLEDRGEAILWRQGRSLPYGEGVSYWAFAEIVKAQAAVLEDDSAAVARRKLQRSVAGLLRDEVEARWIEGHLLPLVGLGEPEPLGEDRRPEVFAAWRRFVEQLARVRPLVLVFEDAQWADEGLLDFVEHLAEWVSDAPLAIVCTARPELFEQRPAFAEGTRLDLEPLSAEDTEALLESLLGGTVPGELRRGLLARAAGNPLYAEEYARMLADRGILRREDGEMRLEWEGAFPLPETVQSIITARLDELEEAERVTLQNAAVVGKEFWPGALAEMGGVDRADVEGRLALLQSKRFIRPQPRSAVEAEPQYVFWHSLVRDVAYAQIPRGQRAEKHRLSAEWIAGLAADRGDDLAEMLAHHYLRAIEYARASGQDVRELEERGRVVLREAGDRALTLYAFGAAVRFYRAACELWPEDDADRPLLLFRYGTSLAWAEEGGGEVLEQAREGLLAQGDLETAAEADVVHSRLELLHGRREHGVELAHRAIALVDTQGPSRAKAHALANLCGFHMFAHESTEAIEVGSQALAMARELGLDDVRAHVLTSVGVARAMAGDRSGVEDVERSIELAERTNSPEAVRGFANLGSLLAIYGELERAFELYDRGRRAAARFGDARGLRWLTGERLYESYWSGDWDGAAALADRLIAEAEAGSEHYVEFDSRIVRSWIRRARGEAAADDADAALRFALEGKDPQALFPALATRALVHLREGEESAAAELAGDALERWAASPAELPSFWAVDLAEVFVALGRGEEFVDAARGVTARTRWLDAAVLFAEGRFEQAAEGYRAIGSLPDEAGARLHSAQVLETDGRLAEARTELERALEFYRRVGAEGLALGAARGA